MDKIDEILLRSKYIDQKSYWKKKLTPLPAATELLPDYQNLPPAAKTAREKIVIPPGTGSQLLKFSKNSEISLYIVLMTVLKILLYRYSNNLDITVISPLYRETVSEDTLNTFLFIRDELQPGSTFIETLLQTRESVLAAYENQDYPFPKLLEYLFKPGSAGVRTLSTVMCRLENIHPPDPPEEVPPGPVFGFRQEADRVDGHITYAADACESGFMRQVSGHFVRILGHSLQNIHLKISGISLASGEEVKRLLYEFNATQTPYPREETLHRLFEGQVEKTPDHIAVTFGDRAFTYTLFNEKTNRWARYLRGKGLGPDGLAVLLIERSVELLVGLMAILKAGGAFVPIDTWYPAERIRVLLEESRAALLLTQTRVLARNKELSPPDFLKDVIVMEEEDHLPAHTRDPGIVNKPHHLAYVLYTSGTTGKPKGVMIEHRGIVNYICWAAKRYVRNEKVNFPLYTSISFDLTMTSIFTPLLTGNAVAVYGEEDNELQITRIMSENRVGAVKLTPSHLKLLKELKVRCENSLVNRLIVGGEDLKSALAKDIAGNFPAAPGRALAIYNEYGPTEAAVGCMIYEYRAERDRKQSVPIGTPVDNMQACLLDGQQGIVPAGVVGELYVSGAGVARGYLDRPELTAEKFLPHPYFPGERMYRTGDLGRGLQDGNIEFLGRIDSQVKIRGNRIELGEIDGHLLAHEEIKDAVTTAREYSGANTPGAEAGDRYLCSYIVSTRDFAVSELRAYLAARLPDYMIPGYFTRLDEISLTANGKVDEKALPVPRVNVEGRYIAPRDEVEETLAGVWSEVLGIEKERIGIEANFFELGGHSLNATIMAAKIHRQLDVVVPLGEIFRTPTIAGIASLIQVLRWADQKTGSPHHPGHPEREEVIL